MATSRESSVEKSDRQKVVEKEIDKLRAAKKELFERRRPINEELERIAQRERECVDELDRIKAEEHDRGKYQETVQRLIKSETELNRVRSENAKLSDTIRKLKLTLDQAAKNSKIQLQKQKTLELQTGVTVAERGLRLEKSSAHARSEIRDNTSVSELEIQLRATHKTLNKTKEELNETRQRLSDVHERLTLAEQVTAATQRRALRESDNTEELPLELTQHHQPTSHQGVVFIC